MWETWVWSMDWEDPLEKGKATHSNILAWRIFDWILCFDVVKHHELFANFGNESLTDHNICKYFLPVFGLSFHFVYCILWYVKAFQLRSAVAQLCPTLCYPVEYSPPGPSVHGIFQARILEWVAISFSRGSFQPRDRTQLSIIADRCFNLWAIREALGPICLLLFLFPLIWEMDQKSYCCDLCQRVFCLCFPPGVL